MFGQQNKPFGGGTTFGATNTSFGTSTPFGGGTANNNSGTFGAKPAGTTGFGTSGGFGTQTQNTGGGLFGTTTTTSAGGSLFGGGTTNTFGQSSGFSFGGQQQQQQQQQTNTGGGLFGGNANTSSIFGTPTTSSAFGAKTPGAFGTTTSTTGGGLFGAQNTGTSLFGSTTQNNNAPATGGLFGGAGSAFGSAAVGGANGTAVAKFAPPAGSDTMMKGGVSTSISTRHQCITAMKEYENKSMEELRSEDYTAQRKGPQKTAGGMFGTTQTQNTGFGFNQQQQTKTAGFTGFGTTTSTAGGGLFGAQQQQQNTGNSLFGGTQNKGLFGQTSTATTSASTGFSFGNTANTGAAGGTSLFGANQAKPGGMFGTTTSQAGNSLFGTTNQNPTTGFGQQNTGFGFAQNNNQQSGGLFGNKTGFGTNTGTTNTGLTFGQTSNAGGMFSGTQTGGIGFGQNTTTGFGTNQNNMFGNKPTGFGTNTTTLGGASTFGTTLGGGLGTGSSLFSGTQNKPGGLGTGLTTGFGAGTANFGGIGGGTSNLLNAGNAGPSNLGMSDAVAVAQQAQFQQQLVALANSPYGDSPLFKNLKQDSAKREEAFKPTNPAAQKAALSASSQYKVSPRPTAKIKPKPITSMVNGKSQLFDGLEDDEFTFGNDTLVPRKSIKKLVIKRNNKSPGSHNNSAASTPLRSQSQLDEELVAPSPIYPTGQQTNGVADHPGNTSVNGDGADFVLPSKGINSPNAEPPKTSEPNLDETIAVLNQHNRILQGRDSSREESILVAPEEDESAEPHPAGIVLRRPGYYTMPAMEELANMVDSNGDCVVDNFVIGREGYGNVFFPGDTNVAGLNIDEIVHFRRKEITVYPDDDKKPEEGEGLNKRAQVTLDFVWPNDKTTQKAITDPDRLAALNYHERIEKATRKIGAKFIDYRPETGSWVFEVKHFSKYGLADDSDDEEEIETDPKKLKLLKEKQQQQLAIQKKTIHKSYQLNGQQQQAEGEDEDDEITELKRLAQKEDKLAQAAMMAMDEEERRAAIAKGLELEEEDDQPMGDDDSEMPFITRGKEDDLDEDEADMDDESELAPSSHRLANKLGVDAHQVQVMKASFFGDDEDVEMSAKPTKGTFPSLSRGLGGSLGGLGGGGLGGGGLGGQMSGPPSPVARTVDPVVRDSSFLSASFQGSRPTSPAAKPSVSPLKRSFIYDRVAHQQQQQQQKPMSGLFGQMPFQSKSMLPPAPDHKILPSGMTRLDRHRKVVGSRIQRSVPSLNKSLIGGKEGQVMDHALVRGRVCRVGWGPGLMMVHCGQPVITEEPGEKKVGGRPSLLPSVQQPKKKRLDASPYQVQVEQVDASFYSNHRDMAFKNMVEQSLRIQLECTESSVETGCPLFVPRPGVESLHRHAELAEEQILKLAAHPDCEYAHQARLVWKLCVALWGRLPEFQDDQDVDKRSYAYHHARREAFSRWLSSAASRRVRREVADAKFKGQNYLSAVLSYLTGQQISSACDLAQEHGDHRMALLLAQSAGSDPIRQMLAQQLANWEECKADQFIDSERLKIYSLMSGLMVWPASDREINVCQDMDWKRCLAIHIWYLTTPTASISDALKAYDSAFMGKTQHGAYAAPPLPPYMEDTLLTPSESGDADRYIIRDMCYHLMKLYSDKSYRLDRLLAPTTATPNHLDYRLSWLLWQILQALSYGHLSDQHAASLCTSLAAQLENLQLWHWAAFVLLHIVDPINRKYAVRGLLERHVGLYKDDDYLDKERFVQDRLLIPAAWIHKAKARRAQYERRHHEEAWHLLKAGHFNGSHEILLRHVAPDALINENYGYLKKYLREMSPIECSSGIQDWDIGGKVFLDYITMVETLDEIKRGDVSAYELEKLEPEVTSLCSRIQNLKCFTAKDRLCQAEMAKRTANLLRTLLMLKNMDSHPQHAKHVPTKLLAPHLSKLPMPEDYALEELRDVTRSYLLEMTSSS